MCGQLGDKPVRQRLDGVVLVIFRFDRSTADSNDRAGGRDVGLLPIRGFAAGDGFRLRIDDDGCFVFRPDIAAID